MAVGRLAAFLRSDEEVEGVLVHLLGIAYQRAFDVLGIELEFLHSYDRLREGARRRINNGARVCTVESAYNDASIYIAKRPASSGARSARYECRRAAGCLHLLGLAARVLPWLE